MLSHYKYSITFQKYTFSGIFIQSRQFTTNKSVVDIDKTHWHREI